MTSRLGTGISKAFFTVNNTGNQVVGIQWSEYIVEVLSFLQPAFNAVKPENRAYRYSFHFRVVQVHLETLLDYLVYGLAFEYHCTRVTYQQSHCHP